MRKRFRTIIPASDDDSSMRTSRPCDEEKPVRKQKHSAPPSGARGTPAKAAAVMTWPVLCSLLLVAGSDPDLSLESSRSCVKIVPECNAETLCAPF